MDGFITKKRIDDTVSNNILRMIVLAPIFVALLLLALSGASSAQPTTPASGLTRSYPVVDTGQTSCYDSSNVITCPTTGEAVAGQDAQRAGNQPSFIDNDDGTISDNVTGLMWQKSADMDEDGDIDAADKLTYDQAQAGAATLTLAGYDDWRLPTIKELYSLIDFSGVDPSGWNGSDTSVLVPFIDTEYFDFAYGDTSAGERIIDAQYASSTLYVSTTMNGNETLFGVNFADGRIKGYGLSLRGRDKTFFAKYVRGNVDYGENDLVDNGDGTITDSATDLMWAQSDSGAGLDWEQALAWVEQSNAENYLGYDDWHLPDAKELQSIVDYSRSPATSSSAAIDPLFNAASITNEAGQSDYPAYWSSTTHANWTNRPGVYAVYVNFGRSMGYMNGTWLDVHGAGAQRSDPKSGDPDDWPTGHGPQGDGIRIYNYVRLVRNADATSSTATATPTSTPTATSNSTLLPDDQIYLPIILDGGSATITPTATPSATTTPIPSATTTPIAPTADGYNLFSPLRNTSTYLIDDEGETVFTWASSYPPGNAVYLLENGNLLRTGNTESTSFDVGGAGGIVEAITSAGVVNWSFEYDTAQGRLHHDIESLPNGNVLMIAWEVKTEAEAIAAGRNPTLLADSELWPDTIIEIDPRSNTIVWEWHVWDHLVQDFDPGKANYGVVADQPQLIDLNYSDSGARPGTADWNHTNAIDYNAGLDQILLSVRGFSEIWVIDHSTTTAEAAGHSGGVSGKGGDLLYRWGNPQAFDSGDSGDQQLFVQHDAQWIPSGYPGEGNILVFNNGSGRAGGNYSSVDEITPPIDNDGNYSGSGPTAGFGPTAPTWSYTAPSPTDFYATNISGAQRLSNGNTLICDGPAGYFFEVNTAGDLVWDYDYGQPVFRVTRYQSNYPGLPTISQ